MSKKTKYSIMSKELKGTYKSTISMVFKLLSINNKLKNKKINDDVFSFEMLNIVSQALPTVLTLAHMGYENNKDLQNIDKIKLFSYLETKKINPAEFSYNYSKNITLYIKFLLLFAILEKENISFPNIKDPELAIKLLEGQGIEELFEEACNQLSPESEDMLDDAFADDFNINDLSEEQKALIDSYHEKYMNKNIYPRVTKDTSKEQTVMKLAKAFGKPKRK